MRIRAVLAVVLAVTAAAAAQGVPLASRPDPGAASAETPVRPAPQTTSPTTAGKSTATKAAMTLGEQVQEMEATVGSMHAVLKQMRSRTASSNNTLARANVDMWELMVGQLDKQLEELRVAEAVRADMEVRRAAMYKAADAKIQAAARAAQAAEVARFFSGGQSSAASSAGHPLANSGKTAVSQSVHAVTADSSSVQK